MKNLKLTKVFLQILLVFALASVFSACSDDDDGGEELVTEYGYKLNVTEGNQEYHRVVVYKCLDNGDDTFEVRNYEIHCFATSNSSYTDRSGNELCQMVENASRTPDVKYEYTLKDNADHYINCTDGTKLTFHLYKGLVYQVYYYY